MGFIRFYPIGSGFFAKFRGLRWISSTLAGAFSRPEAPFLIGQNPSQLPLFAVFAPPIGQNPIQLQRVPISR